MRTRNARDHAVISTDVPLHMRAAGVSVVLEVRDNRLPAIVHWGADLGDLTDDELRMLARVAPVGVLPDASTGWLGRPGLTGHRDGAAWSPTFRVTAVSRTPGDVGVAVAAEDAAARLGLSLKIELTAAGVLTLNAEVRNDHPTTTYQLDGLTLALPVPPVATELLDLTGRWARERSPQRRPFTAGTWLREGRGGKPGHDAALVLVAGAAQFGFRRGEVWGIHVGWSGNHLCYAEHRADGTRLIGGGELLLPGEIRLAPGASYRSPPIYASYGRHGLDELSGRYHGLLRSRPSHPRRKRPVTLNTWEAVYFAQSPTRLIRLADLAAEVGIERFVVDDGWFRGRRSDHAGLGDWYVDPEIWPQGLHPLVDHVRGRGMEFGLWVEPEMVSPDSDLARAHPEWILATGDRLPPLARHQQVLDLVAAYDHVLGRLDALIDEYDIDYLKWDHNRDLVDAGRGPGAESAVHEQTLAVYRMLDELRSRHPDLEIESCSGGGGRIDLGILARTDRVWASDCLDPIERQAIQRWTGLLLPPELIGAHIGAPRSHTTGRTHDLGFRAATAMFGHLGVEWDLAAADTTELAELAAWVAVHKELRDLLHSGTVVRSDHADPSTWVHGVASSDRSQALYAIVKMATGVIASPGMIRLPGLDPGTRYRLATVGPTAAGPGADAWPTGGAEHTDPRRAAVPGSVLMEVGVQAPVLRPDSVALLRVMATGGVTEARP